MVIRYFLEILGGVRGKSQNSKRQNVVKIDFFQVFQNFTKITKYAKNDEMHMFSEF